MATAFQEVVRNMAWYLVARDQDEPDDEDQPSPDISLPEVRTDDDLDRVLRDYFNITLPSKKCCEGHSTPWEAFHDAFFARSVASVWKASRGFGGKSFTLSALAMAEALFLRADVNILGGSGEQSKRVLESIGALWEAPGFPKQCMKASEPGAQRQQTVWKNKIVALMASQASVRGPHPQRLRLDEVDEMKLAILNSALGQPMSKGRVLAHVVMSSTHQYADGTMAQMLKRALESEWPVFEWCLAPNTMVATATGERRIDTLKAGDLVWAFDGAGFRLLAANAVWSNGEHGTIRIITERGEIECTPEHRIRTKSGWVPAGQLQPGDSIITDGVCLREQEAATFEDLPAVLSAADGPAKSNNAGHADDGQGNRAGGGSAVEVGSERGRSLQGAAAEVQPELSSGPVRGRLLPAGSPDRSGMLRTATPDDFAERSTGRKPGGGSEGGGPSAGGPVGPGSALVVQVAAGRHVEVWDLSLPEHHAFLANGHVVHNCYRENLEPHGWLSMAEVERKKGILTKAMWDTEIELQEPSSEGRAFDTDKVEQAFVDALGDSPVSSSKEEVVLEAPVPGAKYGTGADWAKKKNHTVIVTIRHDVVPARVVCIKRTQKRPWPDMAADLDKQASRYRGTAVHDNTGLGQVIDDLITVDAEAFDMVGRQRAELLSEYIASVEHSEIWWPKNDAHPALAAAYSEHKYATREDIYKGSKDGSGKHHLPDTISAAAFAWRACGGVTAAGAMKDPEPDDHPRLQRGIQMGRLSGYIRGGHQIPDDDTTDEDGD